MGVSLTSGAPGCPAIARSAGTIVPTKDCEVALDVARGFAPAVAPTTAIPAATQTLTITCPTRLFMLLHSKDVARGPVRQLTKRRKGTVTR